MSNELSGSKQRDGECRHGIRIDNASRKIDLKEVILSKIPAEVEASTV